MNKTITVPAIFITWRSGDIFPFREIITPNTVTSIAVTSPIRGIIKGPLSEESHKYPKKTVMSSNCHHTTFKMFCAFLTFMDCFLLEDMEPGQARDK